MFFFSHATKALWNWMTKRDTEREMNSCRRGNCTADMLMSRADSSPSWSRAHSCCCTPSQTQRRCDQTPSQSCCWGAMWEVWGRITGEILSLKRRRLPLIRYDASHLIETDALLHIVPEKINKSTEQDMEKTAVKMLHKDPTERLTWNQGCGCWGWGNRCLILLLRTGRDLRQPPNLKRECHDPCINSISMRSGSIIPPMKIRSILIVFHQRYLATVHCNRVIIMYIFFILHHSILYPIIHPTTKASQISI